MQSCRPIFLRIACIVVLQTVPFLWYFYPALPKSRLCAIPLSIFGLVVDKQMWTLFKPVLDFVFLKISIRFLPHKELRFSIYGIAMVNVICRSRSCVCSNSVLSWVSVSVICECEFSCLFGTKLML